MTTYRSIQLKCSKGMKIIPVQRRQRWGACTVLMPQLMLEFEGSWSYWHAQGHLVLCTLILVIQNVADGQ